MPVTYRKRKSSGGTTANKKTRMVARKPIKTLGNTVYRFRRNAGLFNLTGAAGFAPYLNLFTFSLGNLPNASEFAAIFEQYRISHIQLKFYLQTTPEAQAAGSAFIPRLWWYTDHDDATAPTSLDQMRERTDIKCRSLTPYKPIVINVKPAVLMEGQRVFGSTDEVLVPKWKQWLSTATTTTQHLGLKFAIDNFTNTNYQLAVESVYWFQCKNVQ